jgi:hypothetical protein
LSHDGLLFAFEEEVGLWKTKPCQFFDGVQIAGAELTERLPEERGRSYLPERRSPRNAGVNSKE